MFHKNVALLSNLHDLKCFSNMTNLRFQELYFVEAIKICPRLNVRGYTEELMNF